MKRSRMKRDPFLLVIVAVGALLSLLTIGCTRLPVTFDSVAVESRAVDGTAVTTTTTHVVVNYVTMLQNRNLSIDKPGWGKLDYSTSNDPVVRLATILSQMAAESGSATTMATPQGGAKR
jgi:hypothetical protein